MPARKQRAHDPMLNMAGEPVIDPTHRDVHPKSTYEARPGYYQFPGESEPRGQGILFEEKSIPGGFGKARSDRVDAALKAAGTHGNTRTKWRHATLDEIADEAGRRGYVPNGMHIADRTPSPPAKDLVDAVKRSDIPVEHLHGLQGLRFSQGSDRNPNGAAGWYQPRDRNVVLIANSSITGGNLRRHQVSHEIGHHVDNLMMLRGNALGTAADRNTVQRSYDSWPHKRELSYAEGQGRVEAFADKYSQTHNPDIHSEYPPSGIMPSHRGEYAHELDRWGGASPHSQWNDTDMQRLGHEYARRRAAGGWQEEVHTSGTLF